MEKGNHIQKAANLICENFNQSAINAKLEVCDDAELIADFYKTYDGVTEFLYIAPKKEIEEAIQNGAIFFVIKYDGQLAGVAKASKLKLPYPFFYVPKQMDPTKDYWGLSGLYVHKLYREKRLSSVLLKAAETLAQNCNANGIYADFDYRNVRSMKVISKYFNFLGYTDGRNGSKDEATIYTMFFKDFSGTSEHVSNLNIIFEQISFSNARETLDAMMEGVGQSSTYIVPYCGGYNEIVCFDKPYIFENTNVKVLRDITLNSTKIVDKLNLRDYT